MKRRIQPVSESREHERYREATRRRALQPDAMLVASRYRRRYHMLGGAISPGIP